MRILSAQAVEAAVTRLFLACKSRIRPDVEAALSRAYQAERHEPARWALEQLLDNLRIAREDGVATCQDTGMATVFADVGQEVFIDGDFHEAVQRGVRAAYAQGMRKSIVDDALFTRVNTQDNTPAVLHTQLVPGDKLHLEVAAKGFGSENMSAVAMLAPSDGVEGITRFVVESVRKAGSNPCPPIVLGVGIGGNFETVALMAKRATLLPLDGAHPDARYAALEGDLLARVNALGIGAAGLGGDTTALGLRILSAPTHIAGMPCALCVCCHAARHASEVL